MATSGIGLQVVLLSAAAIAGMITYFLAGSEAASGLEFSRGRRIRVSAEDAARGPLTFQILNVGKTDVKLVDATSSCGCATLDVAKALLPRGGALDVGVTMAASPSEERTATLWFTFDDGSTHIEPVSVTVYPTAFTVPMTITGGAPRVLPGVGQEFSVSARFPKSRFGVTTGSAKVECSCRASNPRVETSRPVISDSATEVIVTATCKVAPLRLGEVLRSHVVLDVMHPIAASASGEFTTRAERCARVDPPVVTISGKRSELVKQVFEVVVRCEETWTLESIASPSVGVWSCELRGNEVRAVLTVRDVPAGRLGRVNADCVLMDEQGRRVAMPIPIVFDVND